MKRQRTDLDPRHAERMAELQRHYASVLDGPTLTHPGTRAVRCVETQEP